MLFALIAGCAGQTTQSTTTTSGKTEASVPENPPPSDVAKLTNPFGITPANIAAGRALYHRSCWICHGLDGRGDGPAASHMPQKPINFTSDHDFQTETDGQVFWIIKKGINGTDMTNWETAFTDHEIWQIESYVIQFRSSAANRKGFGTPGATTTSSLGGTTSTSAGATTSSTKSGRTTTSKSTTTTKKTTSTTAKTTTTS